MANAGYRVFGVDRSHQMIEYLSEKARSLGIAMQLVEADMEDFRVPEKLDAAFCALNTFRYLETEDAASNHLRCVADSLMSGGVYIVDFNLLGLPTSYPKPRVEEWTADGDDVSVRISHRFIGGPDLMNRRVIEELTLVVKKGDSAEVIRNEDTMRTYTRDQFENLVQSSNRFRVLAWHGPDFDVRKTLEPGPETERVVVVLGKL